MGHNMNMVLFYDPHAAKAREGKIFENAFRVLQKLLDFQFPDPPPQQFAGQPRTICLKLQIKKICLKKLQWIFMYEL